MSRGKSGASPALSRNGHSPIARSTKEPVCPDTSKLCFDASGTPRVLGRGFLCVNRYGREPSLGTIRAALSAVQAAGCIVWQVAVCGKLYRAALHCARWSLVAISRPASCATGDRFLPIAIQRCSSSLGAYSDRSDQIPEPACFPTPTIVGTPVFRPLIPTSNR